MAALAQPWNPDNSMSTKIQNNLSTQVAQGLIKQRIGNEFKSKFGPIEEETKKEDQKDDNQRISNIM